MLFVDMIDSRISSQTGSYKRVLPSGGELYVKVHIIDANKYTYRVFYKVLAPHTHEQAHVVQTYVSIACARTHTHTQR